MANLFDNLSFTLALSENKLMVFIRRKMHESIINELKEIVIFRYLLETRNLCLQK